MESDGLRNLLGELSAFLLVLQFALFVFRRILIRSKNKSQGLVKFVKFLKPLHVYTGIALVVVALTHGILELNWMKIGTGWILWSGIVVAFILYLFRKKLGNAWVRYHRTLAFILIALLIVHLIIQ